LWQHLKLAANRARPDLSQDGYDYLFRFHSLRHQLSSRFIAGGMACERAEYLLGHQTTGSEHTHPLAGCDFATTWELARTHLDRLLDELGATEEVLDTVVHGQFELIPGLLARSDVIGSETV
jgi:integrase